MAFTLRYDAVQCIACCNNVSRYAASTFSFVSNSSIWCVRFCMCAKYQQPNTRDYLNTELFALLLQSECLLKLWFFAEALVLHSHLQVDGVCT